MRRNSDKLKVVELYNKGYGSTSISKEFQISKTVVKAWLSIYRSKGLLGLEKQPKRY